MTSAATRGSSRSLMREVTCKDCQRRMRRLEQQIERCRASGASTRDLEAALQKLTEPYVYSDRWARGLIDRGGSRSDRCDEHRRKHRSNLSGLSVAYIDLETIGAVSDGADPTGPLGGLGAVPSKHELRSTGEDLSRFAFGMSDRDIVEILELLRDRRVLILKAGTGTGKSTFAPYRLTDPPSADDLAMLGYPVPEDGVFDLAALGPIVVTEPRRQAAIDVATFVGTKLSGTKGVGAGYPVGYQVSEAREHDDACQLIYVTDGTMLHWLRDGRLNRIGTVIIDEAHERSSNIDFILGYLKRNMHQYPHLRVIVTSATFNPHLFQEFFGGPEVAAVKEVEAVKTVGYGMPLFPDLDAPLSGDLAWPEQDILPLHHNPSGVDETGFAARHWPQREWLASSDECEDLHDTTRRLLKLRFTGEVPTGSWKRDMPDALADFVVKLVKGLDAENIHGDVLAFLATSATITKTCEQIRKGLGDAADVYPLIRSATDADKENALRGRARGATRKVVVSTNLAETSLTVEGIRFVVDSGLIAQSEWEPESAEQSVPTREHSRAGIRQRWGRVGRKEPGWVFPLYTKSQYAKLAEDTPPGSTRENLESLVLKTRLSGIDDVEGFPWPAAFQPASLASVDDFARESAKRFGIELARADAALRVTGVVDHDGHPTAVGRELSRLETFGSASGALAILYADRLACVPEVATIVALLDAEHRLYSPFADGLLLDSYDWPDEHRLEAATRHRGITALTDDDAHFVLLAAASWEAADPRQAPWSNSDLRRRWSNQWFLNHDLMLKTAQKRRDILRLLSPAMKKETKRFVEPALLDRARLCISIAYGAFRYRRAPSGVYLHHGEHSGSPTEGVVDQVRLGGAEIDDVVAVRRKQISGSQQVCLSGIVRNIYADVLDSSLPVADAMDLVVAAATIARPDPHLSAQREILDLFPVGQRVQFPAGAATDDFVAEKIIGRQKPFVRKDSTLRAGRRAARMREREAEARPEDASVELRAASEANNGAAMNEVDHDVDEGSCGQCDACVCGDAAACEVGLPDVQDETASRSPDEILENQWHSRVRALARARPRFVVPRGQDTGGGWLEIVGYAASEGGVDVILESDWRTPGYTGDPSAQPGTNSGDEAHVRVGPLTSDHQGSVRIFLRTDRPGRFVLREADSSVKRQQDLGQIAVSLDRGDTAQLDALKEGAYFRATVVPSRAKDCFTITLLELLRAHLEVAQTEVLSKASGSGRGQQFFPAIVTTPPNQADRFEFTLLHHEMSSGVRHAFNTKRDADSAIDLHMGAPILVTLAPAPGIRLPVAGRSRETIHGICGRTDGKLTLKEAQPKGDTLGAAATIECSGAPLTRVTASELAALDDSADWQNMVWTFWAQSHHMRSGSAKDIKPGIRKDPYDVAVPVKADGLATPEDKKAKAFANFTSQFAQGSALPNALIGSITDFGAFIQLGAGLDGLLPNARIGSRRPASEILEVGERVLVTVEVVDDIKKQVTLSFDPFDHFMSSHRIGDALEGRVATFIDRFVRLNLRWGVNGSIRITEFDGTPPAEGQTIRTTIHSYDERRKLVLLTTKGVAPQAAPSVDPPDEMPAHDTEPTGDAAVPPTSAPQSGIAQPRIWQVRDEYTVWDLLNDRYRIDHEDGRSVEVDKSDYLRDARPLHWLKSQGQEEN